jgi:DNA-directed RNA polymerase specialized sigma24 family protein
VPKSLEQELIETLHTVRSLPARSQDELEDYFHDAIVKVLTPHKVTQEVKKLDEWLGYIYKTIARRIACGQEPREYLPLSESGLPYENPPSYDNKLIVKRLLIQLTPSTRQYTYEFFYEGRNAADIARRHHVTRSAVQAAIERGLIAMRKVLEKT